MRNLPAAINWAVNEFTDADLGDVRRTTRLVELAHVLAQHPTATLPEACGDGAMLKAAYRFFANDAIAPQDFLYSHIESTYSRFAQVPWSWRSKIPPKSTGRRTPRPQAWAPWHTACQGLLVHSTLAFTPERVPLGLVAQHVWARDPDGVGKRQRRKQLPISQKESQKWLTSLEAVFSARVVVRKRALSAWRP